MRRAAALRIAACIVMLAASAVGCGSGSNNATSCPATTRLPTPAGSTRDAPPPVPSRGAYLGAFALTGGFSQADYLSSVAQLQTEICRPLDIVHSYLRWQAPFPQRSQLSASRSGQILLLSWTGTDMATMASGADDSGIRTVAAEVKALHSPVFLELRWEMDRPNLAADVHSAASFVAAWDHARAVFAEAGVTNASWVWCPTATGFERGIAPAYYPGNSEVDWICTDAYPTPDGPVEQLRAELASFLAWARPIGKPIMLGEIGVPESYRPSTRSEWIRNAATFVKQTPQIKAVVYFDYNPIGHSANRDYLLRAGTPAMTAFRSLAADPWFHATTTPGRGASDAG